MRQVLIERTPSRIDAIRAYRRRPAGDFTSRRVPVGFWRVIVVWIQECVFGQSFRPCCLRCLGRRFGCRGCEARSLCAFWLDRDADYCDSIHGSTESAKSPVHDSRLDWKGDPLYSGLKGSCFSPFFRVGVLTSGSIMSPLCSPRPAPVLV